MRDFRELLESDRAHVFDGAMGTMLYARGVYINKSFDELNLTSPDLVASVHREYIRAGAEIIETNTYGANAVKLEGHGLEKKVREITRRAAQIAREAAGDQVFVAGAVGPLGIRIEPYGPTSVDEARALFREVAEGLLEGGVDLFLLETFSDVAEVHEAIRAVREISDLPIIAQMAIDINGNTLYGTSPEVIASRLSAWGADVVGLNCSVGPQAILSAVERMRVATDRKLSAQPNAGLPREVDGRQMYMCSPEYMAKYAKRLIQAGAKFVGGCCGTTPEHIKLIANAVRASAPGRTQVTRFVVGDRPADVEPVPTAAKSRLARRVAEGRFVTSVEIVPPRGVDPEKMLEGTRLLKEAGVDAVNVPDGPRAQFRMGALLVSVLIEQRVGIETVTHYCCRDRNLLGMQSDLLGAAGIGLRNLLLITGDPPKMGPYPDATAVFDIDSIGLANMVTKLNNGLDIGGNPIGDPTAFFVGVGVNPAAIDLDHEIRRFEWKVDAGAEYAVTQPVFDVAQLKVFLKRVEHCRIPVVAGIWPLVSYRNAEFLKNEVPGISLPDRVLDRMARAQERGKEAAQAEGLLIAREMLEEVRDVVQGVQVSAPFGRVQLALEVFEGLVDRDDSDVSASANAV
jgi:methionine synthase I (cobalamin-dependent)/5,10-methylenetetrahydrofolate reductase